MNNNTKGLCISAESFIGPTFLPYDGLQQEFSWQAIWVKNMWPFMVSCCIDWYSHSVVGSTMATDEWWLLNNYQSSWMGLGLVVELWFRVFFLLLLMGDVVRLCVYKSTDGGERELIYVCSCESVFFFLVCVCLRVFVKYSRVYFIDLKWLRAMNAEQQQLCRKGHILLKIRLERTIKCIKGINFIGQYM